jgi:hypothetical protein
MRRLLSKAIPNRFRIAILRRLSIASPLCVFRTARSGRNPNIDPLGESACCWGMNRRSELAPDFAPNAAFTFQHVCNGPLGMIVMGPACQL